MVSHLRMEGKYGLHQAEEPDDKHVHVIFTMTDGTQLRYRDVRKFGTMHLFKPGEEAGELPLSQLGPEHARVYRQAPRLDEDRIFLPFEGEKP